MHAVALRVFSEKVCPVAAADKRAVFFTKAKALYTPTNLAKDWTDKGYPVQ